jgi:DNA invertase Pin-like site-specific DNA recombinase
MTNRRTRKPSEPSQTPRTFGYCRVSTTQQADEGHSLADQQSRIVGYCQANGLPAPTEIFVDAGTSGTTSLEKREAGARLLAAVERGDHIIVTKGDRLFRSAKNALNITDDLREKGVSLHLMDMGGEVLNSSISRVIFGVMMMFATLEAERIGERTRSVKEHQRQQGLYVGGTLPFGYVRKGRRVVASPATADTASRIKALYEREGMSCRRIADTLREQGITISHNTVYRIAVGRRKHDHFVASV